MLKKQAIKLGHLGTIQISKNKNNAHVTMLNWNPFEYDGLVYDLSHLHPQVVRYTQPAKGGMPERYYDVQVIYSLHCFTCSYKPEERLVDDALAYSDSRETRRFDFHRYECSKHLPSIVRALPTSVCQHTKHGTFFTVKLLNPKTAIEENYEIYFRASRSGSKPPMVNLFVQSAYIRDTAHRQNQPSRKKVNFFVILHNTLVQKTLKPAPQ